MDWETTPSLLQRLERGDGNAWRQIDAFFRPGVIRFGLRLGLQHSIAEDAAQQTFLAFQRSYESGRYDPERGRLRTWLFGIAYRQICNLARSEARRTPTVELPDREESSRVWDEEWRAEILRRCLDRVRHAVRPRTYAAFHLLVLRELPPERVAARIGMTRNAVAQAKHKVGRLVRDCCREFADG